MRKVLTFFSFFAVICFAGSYETQARRSSTSNNSERAVSLRVLQEKLRSCTSKANCPEFLLNFVGLSKINGYIADEQNQDLIFFGIVDSNAPPLKTENFILALRNVWLKFAVTQGNTRVYRNPGCSIDPNPKVMERLKKIGNELRTGRTLQQIEIGIKKWHSICKNRQKVEVFGLPFGTDFSRIMVNADYYMKRLVDGSEQLQIDGFTSMIDMTLNTIKHDLINNRSISVRINPINRFEFYPGENKYIEDDDIIVIKECPVTLLTEIEYLSKSGKIRGTGKADPIALEFAKNFSRRYHEIANVKPIYQELEGLFRFVALAKVDALVKSRVQGQASNK